MTGSPPSGQASAAQTEALNAALAGPQHGSRTEGLACGCAASARAKGEACAAGLKHLLQVGGGCSSYPPDGSLIANGLTVAQRVMRA